MRIVVLSWRGPGHPLSGGAEQVTWKHIEGWVQRGAEVTLFTSAYKGCNKTETINNIKIIRKGDQFIGVKLAAMKWIIAHTSEIDVIVDEHHGIPFFTPLYSKKKKLVLIHEVASRVWAMNPWPRPINLLPKYLGPVFEKMTLKKIYKNCPFMTVSNSTKDDLLSYGCKNVTVIKNGVIGPSKRTIINKSVKPSLIYLSALAKDKGIEDALEVFKLIDKRIGECHFHIVGRGHPEYENYLKSIAAKNLPKNNFTFHGYVSHEMKFKLLAKSHILINCSYHEGWGLVNIEANLMGTPVIGYNVSGTKDSVTNGLNGLIAEDIHPEPIAELVIKLITNKDMYAQMSTRCVKYAREFSWKNSLIESYKLLCSL